MSIKNKSVCVIGLGSFGQALALELAANGHQVMIIDVDETPVNMLADKVADAVIGDATNESMLKSCGIADYDTVVICVTNNINFNILLTVMLKEMGVKHVVARACSELERRVLKKIGADEVVFPEKDIVSRFAAKLAQSTVLEYIELSNELTIVEIPVLSEWVGKSLIELDLRKKYGINVIALTDADGNITIRVAPDYQFAQTDVLTLLGERKELTKIIKR